MTRGKSQREISADVADRRALIVWLIGKYALCGQDALRERLAQHAYYVSQASLSRDLKAIGALQEAGTGRYLMPASKAR